MEVPPLTAAYSVVDVMAPFHPRPCIMACIPLRRSEVTLFPVAPLVGFPISRLPPPWLPPPDRTLIWIWKPAETRTWTQPFIILNWFEIWNWNRAISRILRYIFIQESWSFSPKTPSSNTSGACWALSCRTCSWSFLAPRLSAWYCKIYTLEATKPRFWMNSAPPNWGIFTPKKTKTSSLRF